MKNLLARTRTFNGLFARLAAIVLLAVLLTVAPFRAALAQEAPSLGVAESFAVLGASTVTNTGPTIVTGDLGVSPGSAVTGFPPGLVIGGTIHAGDAVALQAQNDANTAYINLAGQACDFNLTDQDLGGNTLVPGVYCFDTSAQLTGALTLDAEGDPDAVWVFQIGSTLTTASNASVLFINGAQPCNVFWQVGSSATIGTNTTFVGNILALTSITLTTDATLSGRALALNGAVTMDSNTVSISACAIPPVTPIPPTLSKAFSPATIDAGEVSTLTITLSNPDDTVATLTEPFTDTLPSGVEVASAPTTTCGGTLTFDASSVTLTGGEIPANGSCTVTVPVTADSGGSYINSLPAGSLQTSNGNNVAPAVATLTVTPPAGVVPPILSKAFSPATIDAGEVSTLTITLSNPDDTVATLTEPFTDTLPSGVEVASAPSTTCGGTLTFDTSSVTLTGGEIPANGSCTVTVPVTADSGGSYINSLPAGSLQTSNGNNVAPAVATLTVIPVIPPGETVPPVIGKAFDPATIDAGIDNVSTLTITVTNPNDSPVTGVTFTDTLPSGVEVYSEPTTTCDGELTYNTSSVTLTEASIPANSFCTVTVPVTAPVAGNYINTLGTAIATLTVIPPAGVAPPTLGKTFSPATITAGGISTITITLSNTSDIDAYLTAPLIDTLPIGLVVATDPNASTTCGGTLTANTGDSTVTLTGGLIPANSSCTVIFDVYARDGGSYFNSLPAGALQTDIGINAAPAVATLTVLPLPSVAPPQLYKYFFPHKITAGNKAIMAIILENPNSTAAKLTAPLTDCLPKGVVIDATPKAWTTCSGFGKVQAVAGEGKVTLPETRSIPANGSCIVKVNVTAKCKGSYVNKLPAGSLQTNLGNNADPAVATLTVIKK